MVRTRPMHLQSKGFMCKSTVGHEQMNGEYAFIQTIHLNYNVDAVSADSSPSIR